MNSALIFNGAAHQEFVNIALYLSHIVSMIPKRINMVNSIDSDRLEDVAGESPLSHVATDAASIMAGVPPKITRRAIKALGGLATALVEIPLTKLEGKVLEMRAENDARAQITREAGRQIAAGINVDPEFIQAAMVKHAQKITRHQLNKNNVAQVALEELKSESSEKLFEKDEDLDVSEDWLNVFEGHAGQMGSENMRRLFGKILANEIRRPATFSIRTINLMAQLDNDAAVLFARLCSLASVAYNLDGVIADARVMSNGHPGQNTLAGFGLSFGNLNTLEEYGLIISDYNSHMDYKPAIKNPFWKTRPFKFGGKRRMLTSKAGFPMKNDSLLATGVAFSKAGKELLSIVDVDSEDSYYSKYMQEFFGGFGMEMVDYVE